MAKTATGRHSARELRAMAYAIADQIETRATALRRADPALSLPQALSLAIQQAAAAGQQGRP